MTTNPVSGFLVEPVRYCCLVICLPFYELRGRWKTALPARRSEGGNRIFPNWCLNSNYRKYLSTFFKRHDTGYGVSSDSSPSGISETTVVHWKHNGSFTCNSLPAVHGAMGCGQKCFRLVWRCHQLLSGFLARGHLPRMSLKSTNDKGDNEMITGAVHRFFSRKKPKNLT